MFKITRAHTGHLGSAHSAGAQALAREEKRKEEEHSMAHDMTIGGVALAGLFGIGVLQGRMGGMPELAGVPADLIVGGVGVGLALTKKVPKKWAAASLGAGIAGGGSYILWQGIKFGQGMRKDKGELTGSAPTGDAAKNLDYRTVTGGPSVGFEQAWQGAAR